MEESRTDIIYQEPAEIIRLLNLEAEYEENIRAEEMATNTIPQQERILDGNVVMTTGRDDTTQRPTITLRRIQEEVRTEIIQQESSEIEMVGVRAGQPRQIINTEPPYERDEEEMEEEMNTDESEAPLIIGPTVSSIPDPTSDEEVKKEFEHSLVAQEFGLVPQLIIDKNCTTLVHAYADGITPVYKPVKKIFSIPTSKFAASLKTGSDFEELLPKNTRFHCCNNHRTAFVIEEEPCIRTIKVHLNFEAAIENLRLTGKLQEFGYKNFLKEHPVNYENKSECTFTLSFPYLIYVIIYNFKSFTGLKIYYRTSPLTSKKDLLFKCNLPNIDEFGGCCLGMGHGFKINETLPINQQISSIIDHFWNSTFNSEILSNYGAYSINAHLSTFLHWEYYTKIDPLFILGEDLIPHLDGVDATLLKVIQSIMEYCSFRKDNGLRSILNFLNSKDSAENNLEEYFTSCQGILDAKNGITLDSGEEIILNEKKYYVVDFLIKSSNKYIEEITIEDEDHNTKKVKCDVELMKNLTKQVKQKNELSSFEIGEKQIRVGDIIYFPEERRMTNVNRILKDKDDTILCKCGLEYYFLQNIKFDLLREDSLSFNGLKLSKNERYFIVTGNEKLPHFIAGHIQSQTFLGIDKSYGEIYFKFSNFNLDLNYLDQYYIFKDDIQPYSIARYGMKLYEECHIVKNKCIVSEDTIRIRHDRLVPFLRKALTDARLLIPGFDFDIDFRIGDRVIVADWIRPQEIPIIRTITGFSRSSLNDSFSINMVDTLGNVTETEYINSSYIYVGKIRKIVDEFNGIRAGYKMIAKTKVTGFLRKDCHQVVGFLTDTANGIPLMLCSNLHTVWSTPEFLNQFEFIDPSSRKYEKLIVAPFDISNFRTQSGDLITCPNINGCCSDKIFSVMDGGRFTKRANIMKIEQSLNLCRCSSLEGFIFYGIPNPRFSPITDFRKDVDIQQISVMTNFHNTYMNNSKTSFKIPIRKEEFNVSSIRDGSKLFGT